MELDARLPIVIDSLLDEPDGFQALVEQNSPYFPVQRYFAGNAEYRSSSGQGETMIIAPNFRGDWVFGDTREAGFELFFENPTLIDAARRLFDADVVRPFAVFTNLTWQLPFHQGGGHTDVPAFRGINRSQYPVWLLQMMGHSRLFEEERIRIATAVAWLYRGSDGGFEYWSDGPDRAPSLHEGQVYNTAIMGDNDRMFHRVRPVGRVEDGLLSGMTLDTRLEHLEGDAWHIADGEAIRADLRYEALRISVSWKAEVFDTDAERARVDDHADDIDLAEVIERFLADLKERGIPCARPADPLRDECFIDCLSTTYLREPTVYAN